MDKYLKSRIAALPELYQPLYGIDGGEEAERRPVRSAKRRLRDILKIVSRHPSVAPRILDVGCAQGYISLGISEKLPHSLVTGLDSVFENIELCRVLAERAGLGANFHFDQITDQSFGEYLGQGCDVVLFLNVLHHLCTQIGWVRTRNIVDLAAAQADFVIVELASKNENLDWVRDLPDDGDFLGRFLFHLKITEYSTHVSELKRPLYFCSNKYAIVNGELFAFSTAYFKSHPGALPEEVIGRRYYESSCLFIKKYDFSGKFGRFNKVEFVREVRYLQRVERPKLLAVEFIGSFGVLVREKIEGKLLSQLWSSCDRLGIEDVAKKVVGNLEVLEKEGFYHYDLRPWNLLVSSDGKISIIDYGSIRKRKSRKCFEDFLSLLAWLYTGKWYPGVLAEGGVAEEYHPAVFAFVRRNALEDISFFEISRKLSTKAVFPLRNDVHREYLRSIRRVTEKTYRASSRERVVLTEWATSAEAYAKSKVSEVEELQSVLATEREARGVEQVEAIKQIEALREWATSAEAYAKSKVSKV